MTEFTEIKTSDLAREALNWAVAKSCCYVAYLAAPNYGNPHRVMVRYTPDGCHFEKDERFNPCESWSQCGPLIEKHRVSIIYSDDICDPCAWTDSTAAWHATTPLIAACRAIVASVLGETVSVPKELV